MNEENLNERKTRTYQTKELRELEEESLSATQECWVKKEIKHVINRHRNSSTLLQNYHPPYFYVDCSHD